MASPRRSRSLHWLLVLGALVVVLRLARDPLTRWALDNAVELVAEAGYKLTYDRLTLDPWQQHITLAGLAVRPVHDADTSWQGSRFSVTADRIDLLGVDLPALLFHRRLHVGRLEIEGPVIEHDFLTGATTIDRASAPEKTFLEDAPMEVIRVDTLRITRASGRSTDRSSKDQSLTVAQLDLLLTGIQVADVGDATPAVGLGSAQLALRGVQAHMEPFYRMELDSMVVLMPQDTAIIRGLRLKPTVTPARYHKEVDTQMELYAVEVDSIQLAGFDLAARLERGTLMAQTLHVNGIRVDIHRDKSIAVTEREHRKPMMAETIRSLRTPLALDSVVVHGGQLRYHERTARDSDYGTLTFSDLSATVTGLRNVDVATVILNVDGTARLWERGRVHLALRTAKGEGPATMQANAVLRDLPAHTLNRMTDDLLHVRATSGRIHWVELDMSGDDLRAKGTVRMHYEDLNVQVNSTVRHSKLLSGMANLMIRGSNLPDTKRYRTGSFQVERPATRSVFNYLWLGLREGMMQVMLPPLVLRQMEKAKARSAKERP